MISVATLTFDLLGYVEIDPLASSDYGTYERRGSKVATLDGGVVIADFGFAHGDREFVIQFNPTEEQNTKLKYITEYYAIVEVSALGNVYRARPSYKSRSDISTLTLSIESQVG